MFDFSYGQTIELIVPQVVTSGDDVLMTNDVTVDSYQSIGKGYTAHPNASEFRTYADIELGDLFLYTKTLIDLDENVRVNQVDYELKDIQTYQMVGNTVYRYLIRKLH